MRRVVIAAVLWLLFPAAAHAAATRLLYASDWNGPTQIFAADPTNGRTVGQLTFRHAAPCGAIAVACGFGDPLPSPDGRKIAYVELRTPYGESASLWIADADGSHAHRIGAARGQLAYAAAVNDARYAIWSADSKELAYSGTHGVEFVRIDGKRPRRVWWRAFPHVDAVISPDGRWMANATADAVVLTNRRSGRSRTLVAKHAYSLSWAPSSKAVAYIEGRVGFDQTVTTGAVGVVDLAGHDRVVVRGRGQIESVAWTSLPRGTRYRAPEEANGVFAGGPITHLAAAGANVAYSSCLDVMEWNPAAQTVTQVARRPDWLGPTCLSPDSRDEVYDLALAGDRVGWGLKTSGLVFHWWLYQASGNAPARFELASGSNALGSNWFGAGGLAGAGETLLFSRWETSTESASGFPVTAMTLFRATAASCPCPAIAYGAARQELTRGAGLTPIVALDTDGARIAALRYDKLALYDTGGTALAEFDTGAAAAQLLGDALVAAVPNELRVYGLSGDLRRTWPLPSASVGRDCSYYSEPQCVPTAALKLQDAARGLAAYVYGGEVHVVRIADGRDAVVGFGSEARFMDGGLVYADGARVRLVSWASLR